MYCRALKVFSYDLQISGARTTLTGLYKALYTYTGLIEAMAAAAAYFGSNGLYTGSVQRAVLECCSHDPKSFPWLLLLGQLKSMTAKSVMTCI